MAEKRKPTYDLEAFKAAFSDAGRLHATGSAIRSDVVSEFRLRSFKEKDGD